MRNFLFVTDSGRKNEGLRNSQIHANNIMEAIRLFNIESADHYKNLTDPSNGRNIPGVFLLNDCDNSSFIATIVDLGEI
jgi:hypothetical protein